MDIEGLRQLRLADPFKPFSLVLIDGRRLPVDKPYYLGISPTKRFAVHTSVGGGYEVIRPGQVRGVEYGDVRRESSAVGEGDRKTS